MTADQPIRPRLLFRARAFDAGSRVLLFLLLVCVGGCDRKESGAAPEALPVQPDQPAPVADVTQVPDEVVSSDPGDEHLEDAIPRHDYVQPERQGEDYPIAKFSATPVPSKLIYLGEEGKLVYNPYNEKGDVIPDFSMAGYRRGLEEIPDVPVAVTITPNPDGSDEHQKIMDAIAQIARLPKDEKGFRGALLFKKGTYHVSQPLVIDVDGVVLRGEGDGDDGTVLVATGKAPKGYTFIKFSSRENQAGRTPVESKKQKITDDYVNVGSTSFHVADASAFAVGDEVIVHRPSTAAWLQAIGMDKIKSAYKEGEFLSWAPGSHDLNFDRTITKIEGNRITVDMPLFMALDAQYGGGTIYAYTWPARSEAMGIEKMKLVCQFDPKLGIQDENRAKTAVAFHQVRDCFARDVSVYHFNFGMNVNTRSSSRITMERCKVYDPMTKVRGGHRYGFNSTGGAVLIKDCHSEDMRHAYSVTSLATGPNVVVNSTSKNCYAISEPHHSWAAGTLWDNVVIEGPEAGLMAVNRGSCAGGQGWTGTMQVFWNCKSNFIMIQSPPTGQNFGFGIKGVTTDLDNLYSSLRFYLRFNNRHSGIPWKYEGIAMFGNAYIESPDAPVAIKSLYEQQVRERKGTVQ
jgi:hypothetical protein